MNIRISASLFTKLLSMASLANSILGWILLTPLTTIISRRTQLVLFVGRDGGRFLDNSKYTFIGACSLPHIWPVFLTRDVELRNRLRAAGAMAETLNSVRSLWLWLRAGTIVVDNIDWVHRMRFSASRGARVVQLWHGVPLKYVQLSVFQRRLDNAPYPLRLLLRFQRAATGRYARSSWFLSTSSWVTERTFSLSFRYDQITHVGYPRNDCLFNDCLFTEEGTSLKMIGVDRAAAALIDMHHKAHGKVVLYAPTFRESLDDPFAANKVDLMALSKAAIRLNVLLLVKLHPWMYGRIRTTEPPGLVFVAPDSDIYPLLSHVDFLVTDYSSIFFDFLLLDRPILFFPYDLDIYLSNERPMYLDYEQMTPGPKSRDTGELISDLEHLVTGGGGGEWKNERIRVRSLVFDHIDGHATDRLLNVLFPYNPEPEQRLNGDNLGKNHWS